MHRVVGVSVNDGAGSFFDGGHCSKDDGASFARVVGRLEIAERGRIGGEGLRQGKHANAIAQRMGGCDFGSNAGTAMRATIIHGVDFPSDPRRVSSGPVELFQFGRQGVFPVGVLRAGRAEAVLFASHRKDDSDFDLRGVFVQPLSRSGQQSGDARFQRSVGTQGVEGGSNFIFRETFESFGKKRNASLIICAGQVEIASRTGEEGFKGWIFRHGG